MTLRDVRARRHGLLLDRIAEERGRKERRSRTVRRVKTVKTMVVRDDDDATPGGPAALSSVAVSVGGWNDGPGGVTFADYRLERIEHVSGPVLGSESYSPEDVGSDGIVIITKIAAGGGDE